MGQRGNGAVIIAIAIDRSCAVCGCGARAWACRFIPCVLFEKVSECQMEVRINERRTCLTTLTTIYSE
jgi:hypothetical protein